MKKEIVFTLDWGYGYPLKSSGKGNGEHTKVLVGDKYLNFMVKQTPRKIIIQFDLLEWFKEKLK